jgi:hypothetical protein
MKIRFSVQRSTLGLAVCFAMLCATYSAQAQNIGEGNLSLSLDDESVYNGFGGNPTGPAITLGTTLTAGVSVQGVSGNGGTTDVACYANGSQIFYKATTVSLTPATFTWKPASAGSYTVYCSADYSGNYANGTVYTGDITVPVNAAPVGVRGLVYPKFLVVGVTYAPPGASSDVQYTNTTSVGTTTTYSSSFSNDVGFSIKTTQNIGIPAGKTLASGGITLTYTESTDYTQTQNSSTSVTINKSTSIADTTNGFPTTNSPNGPVEPAVPHDYDVILVWMNPELVFTSYYYPSAPTTPVSIQWNGYAYDPNDLAGPDVYPIQVGCLNGHFTTAFCSTQQGVLNRAWVTGEKAPQTGAAVTAAGCSPQTSNSPSICPNTQDAYNILAADPLAYNPGGKTYTLLNSSPLPTTTSDGRFTQYPYPPNPVDYEAGQTEQYTATQMDTQTQSSGGSTQLKEAISVSEEVQTGFLNLFNSSTTYTESETITQTNTWLNSLTTTTTITDAFKISGSNPPNYVPGEFIVYQDNQMGTFMFYPSN